MNIHPIFIHFPIALLSLYAVLEIAIPLKIKAFKLFGWNTLGASSSFKKMYQLVINPVWNSIKAFLVIFGTLLAFPTLQTGEWAEEMYQGYATDIRAFAESETGKLIELHSTFANLTVIIFSILAVGYLARILWTTYTLKLQKYTFIEAIPNIVLSSWVAPLLALAGIVAITITGALGGAIAHGPDTDPVVQMIYGWFF